MPEREGLKPMDKVARAGCRVAAGVLFGIVVAVFVRAHFMGPPHTEEHTILSLGLEYTPLTAFSILSLALFAQPEATVRLFLKGIDAVVTKIPAGKMFVRDRRGSSD
jgi:hypothetical protein